MDKVRAAKLTGRCASGAERDKGTFAHAVEVNQIWGNALCGAKPGKRSNGFSIYDESEVTCPKCLKKLGNKQ